MNGDGKMDINEFSVACKLINLKLKGMELPKSLPPQLMNSGAAMGMGGMVHPTSLPLQGGMRPMQPGMPGELHSFNISVSVWWPDPLQIWVWGEWGTVLI